MVPGSGVGRREFRRGGSRRRSCGGLRGRCSRCRRSRRLRGRLGVLLGRGVCRRGRGIGGGRRRRRFRRSGWLRGRLGVLLSVCRRRWSIGRGRRCGRCRRSRWLRGRLGVLLRGGVRGRRRGIGHGRRRTRRNGIRRVRWTWLRWRGFFLGRSGFSDVGQIRTHSHFTQQRWPIEDVIARRAAAVTPFWRRTGSGVARAIHIGSGVIGADLFAVTIEATVRDVNAPATLSHSGFRHRINVGAFFVALRIEMTNLQIGNVSEPKPGKGKGREDSKNERSKTFHQCATISPGSGFTGFKNVGTLAVRPRPRSMSKK